MNVLRTKFGASFVILSLMPVFAGCSAPGDTSGFKPEQKLTKDQINQQIADIKANKQMPDGMKDSAIKSLEKQLPGAQ
jgi:hypothetical protein